MHYFPIPYQSHCKITYESDRIDKEPGAISGDAFFYNINYRAYNKNVAPLSNQDLSTYSRELQLVKNTIQNYNSHLPEQIQSEQKKSILLTSGKSTEIIVNGTRAIRQVI